MRFYIAKQKETLPGIYAKFYGSDAIELDSPWDSGFCYFLQLNAHHTVTAPIFLHGGEVIILPYRVADSAVAQSIDLDELGG